MRIFDLRKSGIWPDGEPESVRAAADARPRAYDVYMLVFGGYDAYIVVAVFADRASAQQCALSINEALASAYHGIECYARVEEIPFYPAGVLPSISLQ